MFNFKIFMLSLCVVITAVIICYSLCESQYRQGYYQGRLDEMYDYVHKQHKRDSIYDKQNDRLREYMDENYELRQQLNAK